MSASVYYAINDSVRHCAMLKKSVETLRRYNKHVPVTVHAYGGMGDSDQDIVEKLDVKVATHPVPQGVHGTALKWVALAEEKADSILYVDADTYFFGDPEQLLGHDFDFCAREEVGCEKHGRSTQVGILSVPPQLDRAKFKELCKALDSRAETVFNTGVMVFNRGASRLIAEAMLALPGHMQQLGVRFPYPSPNKHIAEEIVAAAILGGTGLRLGLLSPEAVPFFVEYAATVPTCVVVHTWTIYWRVFVEMVEGKR